MWQAVLCDVLQSMVQERRIPRSAWLWPLPVPEHEREDQRGSPEKTLLNMQGEWLLVM